MGSPFPLLGEDSARWPLMSQEGLTSTPTSETPQLTDDEVIARLRKTKSNLVGGAGLTASLVANIIERQRARIAELETALKAK